MKNILVPVGSSNSAITTLQYAIDFAEVVDANVYVISVFQEFSRVGGLSKVNTILKEESEGNIANALKNTNHKNVSVIAHPIKGNPVEGVERLNKHIPIDLMILSPRSNAIQEELYLGPTTGKLVKQTEIPTLIVPEGTNFEWPKSVLIAFKDGRFKRKRVLDPLGFIIEKFNAELHLLHVKTPDSMPKMEELNHSLQTMITSYKITENATTYQGVLEHFQSYAPDMICVVRRKRGFFKKLWEKNTVLKQEFYTTKPLLILRGVE